MTKNTTHRTPTQIGQAVAKDIEKDISPDKDPTLVAEVSKLGFEDRLAAENATADQLEKDGRVDQAEGMRADAELRAVLGGGIPDELLDDDDDEE